MFCKFENSRYLCMTPFNISNKHGQTIPQRLRVFEMILRLRQAKWKIHKIVFAVPHKSHKWLLDICVQYIQQRVCVCVWCMPSKALGFTFSHYSFACSHGDEHFSQTNISMQQPTNCAMCCCCCFYCFLSFSHVNQIFFFGKVMLENSCRVNHTRALAQMRKGKKSTRRIYLRYEQVREFKTCLQSAQTHKYRKYLNGIGKLITVWCNIFNGKILFLEFVRLCLFWPFFLLLKLNSVLVLCAFGSFVLECLAHFRLSKSLNSTIFFFKLCPNI